VKRIRTSALLLVILACAPLAPGAEVEFKMITVRSVLEPRDLALLRDELFLGSETIERILIVDVLNDGFDENDVVQLYPSGRVLRLQPISARLDSLLRSYRLPPNVEIHETRQYFSRYDSLARAKGGGQALGYGLMAGLTERLMRGYRGQNVEGYFKFNPTAAVVQAWNFDSTAVHFPPPDAPRVDTVRIFERDTIRVPEVITVTPEPVVIRDTVFIPSELFQKPRGYFYRLALGLFGGGYSTAQRKSSRGRLAIGAGNEWDFGVWDPWISGRQDIRSRTGLRFVAEMAPWKSDTLSPRFLSTSLEGMFIPAWDRSFFIFGGIRAFYRDDLFWDRTRAAWDEDLYAEPAAQDLSQYEFTVKTGLDKFASFGTGKRFGAWLKLSGWIPGGKKSGYDVHLQKDLVQGFDSNFQYAQPWRWEYDGGTDVEAAVTARLSDFAQAMVSFGQITLAELNYSYVDSTVTPRPPAGYEPVRGAVKIGQSYQTAALRFAPYNASDMRVMLEAAFTNYVLSKTIKKGADEAPLKAWFFPYWETPELGLFAQLDASVVRFRVGARYLAPPEGKDSQLRPEATLHLLFR
jgi:hypothetical protein